MLPNRTSRFTVLLFAAILTRAAMAVAALPVAVPNFSFESPVTTFVNTHIDFWQKTAKPDWYDESGPFLWDQLTGTFKNSDSSMPDHIDNCDGAQAIWMFTIPEAGIFQDYESIDWSHTNAPLHAFNAAYEVGKAYQLTVGLIGGGGNMPTGATVDLGFYYRDSQSNRVRFASKTVTNSLDNFSSTTHFVDFSLLLSTVTASDLWAGHYIGIELISSTTDTNLQGGYWDIDNVRVSVRNPILLNPAWTNGQFQFTIVSDPGLPVQIVASNDPLLPASNWSILATVTNVSGALPFTDTSGISGQQRFYQARTLP